MRLAVASAAVTACLLLTACAAPPIQATGPALAGAPFAVAAAAVWPPTVALGCPPVRPPRPFTAALDMPDPRDLAWQASGAR